MATEIDKHYAKKLKKLREGRKIKQFAMLDYLHLDSQQQYSDLENGKNILQTN
jgi:transcriptional regulator with XRE-family HTH domain